MVESRHLGTYPPGQRMPEWLIRRAATTPEKTALVHACRRYSFASLNAAVDRAAQSLVSHGVRPGEHVALLANNNAAYVVAVHALIRLGAVLIPINIRLTPREIDEQLADAGVQAFIHDHSNAVLARDLPVRPIPLEELAWELAGDAAADSGADPDTSPTQAMPDTPTTDDSQAADALVKTTRLRTHIDLEDLHSIVYTSGTTGRPKGAMITFGNHWWSAVGSALNLGTHERDVWLACLPLFHVGGLAILMRSVIYGITAVVHDHFDSRRVNDAIDTDGVTILSVVSNMLQRMLDERGRKPYPKRLRCVLAGGGPVPKPLLERCAARGIPVVQTYGFTEGASQIATLPPADALRKIGSAGKPLFPTELRIDQGPGEVGEILVRGPTVGPGYFNHPAETSRSRRDGWFRTGDLGYLDDEGYLFLVARRKDLIISGGENVYPAEVESVLQAHPGIAEAGVVGVPDVKWGQVPVACVVLRKGSDLSEESLISFCKGRLASYKVPDHIYFVESLPWNATGKLSRRRLAEMPAITLRERTEPGHE